MLEDSVLRLDESFLEFVADATTTMKLQSSDDLKTWTDEATVENVEIDLSGGKRFFRFQAEETPKFSRTAAFPYPHGPGREGSFVSTDFSLHP